MKKHLPLLDYNPWSPSKADLAAQCGLAFKYRYVDRIAGGPKGTPAKVGTTVHRAQELLLQGSKVKPALDQAIAESKDPLTHSEEEQIRAFAQAIISFNSRIEEFKKKFPVRKVLLEQKWSITPEFQPCEWFDDNGMIRGIVDFGLLLENGHLVIIDHKSGRPRPLSYYGTQLDIYAVMAHAHFPDIKGVQCALHYLQNETVLWGTPKTVKHITHLLRPWLLKYLNTRAEALVGFEAKIGRHCNWCDYRDICPQVQNEQDGESNSNSNS